MSLARSPLPWCGMKLLASQAPTVTTYACLMHPDVTSAGARPLPQVRHEAARQPGSHGDHLRMPDASRMSLARSPAAKCGMKLLASQAPR